MALKNTDKFRPAAKYYEKYSKYEEFTPKSKAWRDYWREEQRRCTEGYEVDGDKITGYHYFYLNYMPIMKIPDDIAMGEGRLSSGTAEREWSFPSFWDGDYDFFWCIEIARKGIHWGEYQRLGLLSELDPEQFDDNGWLRGGWHMAVLKARGRGFSYKLASMLACNYFHKRKSMNYAVSAYEEYTSDIVYDKTWSAIDFVDKATGWKQGRLKNDNFNRICGLRLWNGSSWTTKGRLNEVKGMILSDPYKMSGKRGDIVAYEESGLFPGLKVAWDINRPSMEQDGIAFGLQCLFGTGGSTGKNFEDMQNIHSNPLDNNVLPFLNQFEAGLESEKIGYFFPVHWNKTGYMDKDGNSLVEEVKKDEEKTREGKKQNSRPDDYERYLAMNPMCPSEASMDADVNSFPTHDLSVRKKKIIASKLHQMGTPVVLTRSEGKLQAKPSNEVTPYYKFPPGKGEDKTGCPVIYHAPYKDETGNVPGNLYVIGHDPYAHDKTEGPSIGAAYVFKNPNMVSKPDDLIVASYIGRPETMDEYNKNLFRLAEFYNAKIGFENDRGGVIAYAKRYRLLHYLCEEPTITSTTEKRRKGESRRYGVSMNLQRKLDGEGYVADWLIQPRGSYEDGSYATNLDEIYDPGLVEELVKYRRDKGNFDRVMALMVGMYFMMDTSSKRVEATTEMPHSDFFDRVYGSNAFV